MKKYGWKWMQGKTVKKNILANIIISVIPVIVISLFLGMYTRQTVSRQLEQSALRQVFFLTSELNQNFTMIRKTSVHFSDKLDELTTQLEDEQISSQEFSNQIGQQLDTYEANFTVPNQILYYPRPGNDIYTREGLMSYVSFHNSGGYGKELEMISFFSLLNRVTHPVFMETKGDFPEEGGRFTISLEPISLLDTSPKGTVAFITDASAYSAMIEKYCGELSGFFLIYDSNYELRYGNSPEKGPPLSLVSSAVSRLTGTGIVKHMVDNQPFVTIRFISEDHSYIYNLTIPAKEFYRPMRQQVTFFILPTILLVFLLLFLATLLAIRNYKPILNLAKQLNKEPLSHDETDIFDFISSEFQDVVQEKNALSLLMAEQKTVTRQYFLDSLLEGRFFNQADLDLEVESSEIVFSGALFFVAVIDVDTLFSEDTSILPVMDSLPLKKGFVEASTLKRNSIVLLMSAHEATLDQKDIRLVLLEELQEQFLRASCTWATFSAGSLSSHILSTDMSYCEGVAARKENSESLVLYQKGPSISKDYICPPTLGIIFQQSLSIGNEKTATDITRQMTAAVIFQHPPYLLARCYCFFIVNIMLQVKNELALSLDYHPLIRATNHSDLTQFQASIEGMIHHVCQEILLTKVTLETQLRKDIFDYINLHYCAYDISTESVAQQFRISESQLRTIMREEEAQGLTSYVTHLRFAHIKKRLLDTDIPIRDLVNEIGYADPSSFTRRFKSVEGVTPGQYRQLGRKKGNTL